MRKAISRPPAILSAYDQDIVQKQMAMHKQAHSEGWADYVQKTMQRERELAIQNQQNRLI